MQYMRTNLYSPTDSAKAIETSTPIREVLDKMLHDSQFCSKELKRFALDSHDPNNTDYPINSYVLYTAPTDLVDGKFITTHILIESKLNVYTVTIQHTHRYILIQTCMNVCISYAYIHTYIHTFYCIIIIEFLCSHN